MDSYVLAAQNVEVPTPSPWKWDEIELESLQMMKLKIRPLGWVLIQCMCPYKRGNLNTQADTHA